MAGILDSIGLGKLQENLLQKGPQNRVLGLRLGKALVVAKYVAMSIQPLVPEGETNPITLIAECCEDNQMVMLGRSRHDFLESIKGQLIKDETRQLGEKS